MINIQKYKSEFTKSKNLIMIMQQSKFKAKNKLNND